MPSIGELLEVALFNLLDDAASLDAFTIFNTQPVRDATLPYIVFSHVDGRDAGRTLSKRGFHFLYQVKAVVEGGYPQPALVIDALIDAVMEGGVLTGVTGFDHLKIERKTDFRFAETLEGDEKFYHAGASYEIWEYEA